MMITQLGCVFLGMVLAWIIRGGAKGGGRRRSKSKSFGPPKTRKKKYKVIQ